MNGDDEVILDSVPLCGMEWVNAAISGKESMPARNNARAHEPSNRSLERGLRILRVFRPGLSVLGNGEIAESTGLPRSTVSRLTQTLVACGFLQHDNRANAYRLGPPVLSLTEALLSSCEVLQAASPLMRELVSKLQVNVSLTMADQFEMVYLESMWHRSISPTRRRRIGRRTPMERTAFGRAHLATLQPGERRILMNEFRRRHPENWKTVREGIQTALSDVAEKGYCIADTWLQGITAIATPIVTSNRHPYVLGISGPTSLFSSNRIRNELLPPFLKAANELREQTRNSGQA